MPVAPEPRKKGAGERGLPAPIFFGLLDGTGSASAETDITLDWSARDR